MSAFAIDANRSTPQLAALLDLVSQRTGILRSLQRRQKGVNEPTDVIIYDAWLSHFDSRRADVSERWTSGKGATEEDAMLGAVGEAMERYCASHVPERQLRRAAAAELVGAVPPSEVPLYSPSQYAREGFPFEPWRADAELLWIRALEFGSDQTVWIPASLAFLAERGGQSRDSLCASTSSGLAAGPDLETALRSAVLEVLEREAFLITWLNGLSVPEIDYSAIGGVADRIRRCFQSWGVDVRAFQLATDMPVSAVAAVAVDQTGYGPTAAMGLGCELDPERALQKAMLEVCEVHEALGRTCRRGSAVRLEAYADVSTPSDHAAFFFRRDHLHELEFLLKPSSKMRIEEIPFSPGQSIREDLQVMRRALNRAGCRFFFRDLTTPDLLPFPVRVVRAMITEVQPMHFGYGLERLGGRRLYELPFKLGRTEKPTSEASLNRCPHPLASG